MYGKSVGVNTLSVPDALRLVRYRQGGEVGPVRGRQQFNCRSCGKPGMVISHRPGTKGTRRPPLTYSNLLEIFVKEGTYFNSTHVTIDQWYSVCYIHGHVSLLIILVH